MAYKVSEFHNHLSFFHSFLTSSHFTNLKNHLKNLFSSNILALISLLLYFREGGLKHERKLLKNCYQQNSETLPKNNWGVVSRSAHSKFSLVRNHSFITYAKTFQKKKHFSTPDKRNLFCAYQALRNISFAIFFSYELNEWSLMDWQISKITHFFVKFPIKSSKNLSNLFGILRQ